MMEMCDKQRTKTGGENSRSRVIGFLNYSPLILFHRFLSLSDKINNEIQMIR